MLNLDTHLKLTFDHHRLRLWFGAALVFTLVSVKKLIWGVWVD